jgi:hypothetical protein
VAMDPANWSQGLGRSGSEKTAEFYAAASKVRWIGIAFSGGCFYDMGITTDGGTGQCTLTQFAEF